MADFRSYSTPRSLFKGAQCVLSHCYEATGLCHRTKGLLGSKSISQDEGLLILNCNSVHTFFMAYPIDVCFLDHTFKVVRKVDALNPFRLSPWVFKAKHVLEASSGWLETHRIQVGDHLKWSAE